MFRFMIMFASCFGFIMMGKTHAWGTFTKHGAELGFCLVLALCPLKVFFPTFAV
jgi:hypothetical protein